MIWTVYPTDPTAGNGQRYGLFPWPRNWPGFVGRDTRQTISADSSTTYQLQIHRMDGAQWLACHAKLPMPPRFHHRRRSDSDSNSWGLFPGRGGSDRPGKQGADLLPGRTHSGALAPYPIPTMPILIQHVRGIITSDDTSQEPRGIRAPPPANAASPKKCHCVGDARARPA